MKLVSIHQLILTVGSPERFNTPDLRSLSGACIPLLNNDAVVSVASS